MSEAIILRPGTEQRRRRSKSAARVYGIIILVLLFFAFGEILFQFIIAPRLVIKHIDVESDFDLSESEILRIAGIERKEYYFSVSCEEIRRNLASYTVVREARVTKVFPDTLKIVLKRRVPLAMSFSFIDGRMIPVTFDEEGIIFQIGQSITEWNLPVVSGLRFTPVMGLRLPGMLKSFLEEMKALRDNTPELYNLISEIKIYSTSDVDYELLFYPLGYTQSVNFGREINSGLIKYSLMVLDVLDKQGMLEHVEELDFRTTGEVVYRMKEG